MNFNLKKLLNFTIISFLIIVLLELTLFNMNSYRLLLGNYNYKKYSVEDMNINGMTHIYENDSWIIRQNNPYIELNNIDEEIATICVNIESVLASGENENTIPIKVYYTDATSENYRYLPEKEIVNDVENSKYITCYLSRKK